MKLILITILFLNIYYGNVPIILGPCNMQVASILDQVRSGILLRVNEISTGPVNVFTKGKNKLYEFFQGLTNELADKQDEEKWVDHATSPIPWTVFHAMAMVLMQTNVV